MGGAPKKIVRATKKTLQKVEKAFVEPLEKPVKRISKGVENIAKEGFEELIEKPGKKIIREVVDTITNTDKYDRGTPKPDSAITPEITPEIVPDEKPTITSRYATRGKRSGQAGTIMEGYGVIQRKKSSRSVTQEIDVSFLKPKVYVPPPPPVPEEPEKADYEKAAALAGEAESKERKKRRGRGSTIVAGSLDETSTSMSSAGGKPTLLG